MGAALALWARDREGGLLPRWVPSAHRRAFRAADHWSPWQLGQEGKVPLQSAHLYYNVTEKVRRVMESYFRLDTPLYFSYSHLVCRTAIEGGPSPSLPLSLHTLCALALVPRTWGGTGQGPFHPSWGTRKWQPSAISAAQEVTVNWEDRRASQRR